VALVSEEISDATSMHRPIPWVLVAVAGVAMAVFVAVTVVVVSNPSLAFDARAFTIAGDLRTPWLDSAARVVTTLGLIAVVGAAVALAAVFLFARHEPARGAALVAGAALSWLTVWIIKAQVDRARPPEPLVHTSGQSYPSAHAANSVGWLAIAIALTVVIPTTGRRIAVIAAGAVLTVLVGLSRIYLRAHYASDVVGGEALAVSMYALAASAAVVWDSRRVSRRRRVASVG